jgi:TIR domain
LFITFLPSLVGRAIEFYSCFISHSHKDDDFARRLHARMRSESLRVWFAPEDLQGGKKLYEEVFRAIQYHDKLLLVLSEHSMKSEWVISEIRGARKVEREEKRRKLFPIRLVDFENIQEWVCFDGDRGMDLALEVREYYIPDFSNWKDHDSFEKEFAKPLRDLKAEQR